MTAAVPARVAMVRGAAAGALAAGIWAVQQPLDKRLLRSDYDDVELLGKLVTRRPLWRVAGTLFHLANGAIFGAGYGILDPRLPGPPGARGVLAAQIEHLALWPLVRVTDRYHPARRELTTLTGNRRAFAQATWRHALFGLVLGEALALAEGPGAPATSRYRRRAIAAIPVKRGGGRKAAPSLPLARR